MNDYFEIEGWSLPAENSLALHYRSSKFGAFTEIIEFPETAKSLAAVAQQYPSLLDLTAVVLGVSYYKTNPTGLVVVKSGFPTEAAARFAHALYVEGLGEFYVRNGIKYPPAFRFEAKQAGDDRMPPTAKRNERAIVAFGGGKDSHVALALLQRAGVAVEPTSVTLSDKSKNKLQDMSALPLTTISRRIDGALLEANKAGALNGHVPVTAINSMLLLIYALLRDADWVVFANERSADEPTLVAGGHEINHQFSKTYRCEELLRQCLQSLGPGAPDYFSLLRPVSELWIAKVLSQLPDALDKFSSCNRNFIFSGPNALPPGVRWCGHCAKCVFTALITAPFLPRQRSLEVFGSDVLDDPANVAMARELVGLSEAKPWDCVGTVREAAAALSHLAEIEAWRDAEVVRETLAALHAKWGAEYLREAYSEAMAAKRIGFLPPKMAFIFDPIVDQS